MFDTTTGSFWFHNGTSWVNITPPNQLADADNDTKIQVEESPDEDIIRFDLAGTENMVPRKNANGVPRLELLNSIANTFVGQDAGTNAIGGFLTGSSNTGIGVSALYSNTAGNSNTANGVFALYSNTIGTP